MAAAKERAKRNKARAKVRSAKGKADRAKATEDHKATDVLIARGRLAQHDDEYAGIPKFPADSAKRAELAAALKEATRKLKAATRKATRTEAAHNKLKLGEL